MTENTSNKRKLNQIREINKQYVANKAGQEFTNNDRHQWQDKVLSLPTKRLDSSVVLEDTTQSHYSVSLQAGYSI